MQRYRRENGLGDWCEACPVDIANWLLSLKSQFKASSWRFYRSSLCYFLAGIPGHRASRAIGILEADAAASAEREGGKKGGHLTSSLKSKSIPNLHYEKLLSFLSEKSTSQYALHTATWLRAGLLTALRPSEWRSAELVHAGDVVFLKVVNAKATNGRGTGVARTLDISNFSTEDRRVVARMVDFGKQWESEGVFSTVQEQCAGFLYDANRRLWPKKSLHYTLYSTRHQAIANWKSILPPVEIAALVGHIVTSTAATHYGRRRNAWSPGEIPAPPRPLPEEVALVRDQARRFMSHQPKLAKTPD